MKLMKFFLKSHKKFSRIKMTLTGGNSIDTNVVIIIVLLIIIVVIIIIIAVVASKPRRRPPMMNYDYTEGYAKLPAKNRA